MNIALTLSVSEASSRSSTHRFHRIQGPPENLYSVSKMAVAFGEVAPGSQDAPRVRHPWLLVISRMCTRTDSVDKVGGGRSCGGCEMMEFVCCVCTDEVRCCTSKVDRQT